jgi:phosphatidate cytidylyltransferase
MSELAKRTVFGSLFVIVMIGSILLNYWAFFVVMLATVVIGSQEVSKLMLKEDNRGLTIATAILGTLFFVLSVVLYPYSHILQIVLLLTPLLIALFSKKYPFEKVAVSCWTAMFFVALPCVLMMEFYWNSPVELDGKYLIIMLFCLIWINDIFAYLTGMAIGKHKLFERISPKKTIEGSMGGLVMTVLTAFLVNHYWLQIMDDWKMMGMAMVVVVFGGLGDLCESMMKRQAGVKDSGNVIPGHGGILDRFDATFLAVPAVWCYLMIF